MNKRSRIPFRSLVVAAWLLVMGWFVRYEAFPEYFTNTLAGYQDIFNEGQMFVDSWMKILFKDVPIGFSHTSVEVVDDRPDEHFRMSNRTVMQMRIMGENQHVNAETTAGLDVLYKLQRFSFSLSSRHYSVRILGLRKEGDSFDVSIRSPAGNQRTRVEIPDEVVLYSPMTELAMSRLALGDKMRIKTIDPASMAIADLLVTAVRKEPLTISGQPVDATVLSVDYQGMELTTWIDSQGRTLRQETPFGWTMEACDSEEALKLDFDTATDLDLLAAMAVPFVTTVEDIASCSEVVVRLDGASTSALQLETARQQMVAQGDRHVDLRVTAARLPVERSSVLPPDESVKYLATSAFIQSDDPDIQHQARKLAGGLTDPWAKAVAIHDWVHKHVRKEPAVSLPSAVDVLKQMKGDCNEHTYLFVALARAAGVPAQVRAGLLYNEGNFFYHAWPAVYVGGWVEMDPTVGQPLASIGHISLLEGEFADQLKLLGVMGRLKIELLESTCP